MHPFAWNGLSSACGSLAADASVCSLSQIRLLAVFVNSLFSFWWDVTNDWGLELLRPHTLASTPAVVADSVRSLHLRGASLGAVFSLSSQSEHKTSLHPHHHNHNGQSIHHPSSPSLKVGSSALAPSTSRHRRQPTALRPPQVGMLFPPSVYRGAILADLLLRFLWSLKLSSHLHHVVELETGVFALEALEIIRRWAWVFLRVEWEAVKTSRGVGMGNGDIDEEDGRQTVGLEPIQ